MILLDEIVEVFHLSQFNLLGKYPGGFQVSHRFGIRSVFVHVDDSWFPGVGSGERFQKELLGCLCIPRRTEEEVKRVSLRNRLLDRDTPIPFSL